MARKTAKVWKVAIGNIDGRRCWMCHRKLKLCQWRSLMKSHRVCRVFLLEIRRKLASTLRTGSQSTRFLFPRRHHGMEAANGFPKDVHLTTITPMNRRSSCNLLTAELLPDVITIPVLAK